MVDRLPRGRTVTKNLGRYADWEYTDAAFYDLENRWGEDDEFFLALARESGGPVLDLGCGTGRLTRAVALAGIEVTGIDPTPAMLARARALDSEFAVEYFPGDARDFWLERRFRLAMMTAHAFQHLVGSTDQAAALANIAAHLLPHGHFAFDLRNVAAQDFSRPGRFRRRGSFYDREGLRVDVETVPRWNPADGTATYLLRRRTPATGEIRRNKVVLQYTDAAALDRLLAEAGFEVLERYGDWPNRPFEPNSPEIIMICRKR
jgi:SAM-dependent methyltransferase